jgi:hypothetical protein
MNHPGIQVATALASDSAAATRRTVTQSPTSAAARGRIFMWQLGCNLRCHVSFYLSSKAANGKDAKKVMWQRGNISWVSQPGIARYHTKMLCKLLCKCATPLPHRNFLFQYTRGQAAIQTRIPRMSLKKADVSIQATNRPRIWLTSNSAERYKQRKELKPATFADATFGKNLAM